MNLHSTYQPHTYYTDVRELPKDLFEKIVSIDNLDIESSRYTCGETTAFLRGDVTLKGVDYSYEIHLCRISEEDAEYCEENEIDEDVHLEGTADEIVAYIHMGQWEASIYLTEE